MRKAKTAGPSAPPRSTKKAPQPPDDLADGADPDDPILPPLIVPYTLPDGRQIEVVRLREYPDTFDPETHAAALAAYRPGPVLNPYPPADDTEPLVMVGHGTYAKPDLCTEIFPAAAPPWEPQRQTLAYWKMMLPGVRVSLSYHPNGFGGPKVLIGEGVGAAQRAWAQDGDGLAPLVLVDEIDGVPVYKIGAAAEAATNQGRNP